MEGIRSAVMLFLGARGFDAERVFVGICDGHWMLRILQDLNLELPEATDEIAHIIVLMEQGFWIGGFSVWNNADCNPWDLRVTYWVTSLHSTLYRKIVSLRHEAKS